MKAGVIGLGVGEQHAAAYSEHPRVELAALCDIDEARLREAGARFPGVRLTTSPEELLDDPEIELVSIASYDSAHHEQVVRALRAGKHVFAEKPLCQTRDQTAEIHALLVERPELVLSSNLLLRASPRFELLKRWIGEGRLGRIYYMEADYDYGRLWKLTDGWRGDLDTYSVMLGGGVHVVDLLLWLTGEKVVSARASGNRITTEGTKFRFNDLVVALLELESGAVAKVAANFGCVHPHFHDVQLFGTDGTFVNGQESASLYVKGADGPVREQVDAPYPGVGKGVLIGSFVEAAAGGPPPLVTAQEVFDVMAVCLAIDRSAETGDAVPVETFG
ncbi:MAG TPA: Gfo/Idh/MocA family oxidoreductase [Thermoleophilaceae bacterium]